jgi:uncharacterized Zn finger protein (UPF0148 family)
MSVNPNVIGGILAVVVISIFVLYAWIDIKKRPQHSVSPKHAPSGIRCEKCGAPTFFVGEGLLKCDYCGNTQKPSKDVNEPQNLDKGKQEQVTVKEVQEEKKQEGKQKHIKSSDPLFADWEYKPKEYELTSKDPLGDFVDDAKKAQKNEQERREKGL